MHFGLAAVGKSLRSGRMDTPDAPAPDPVPSSNPVAPASAAAPLDSTAAPSKDERMWAMFAHLSAFAIYFTGLGHVLGPLIIWMVKRDTSSFINDQGKESLNFQISLTIYGIGALILCMTVILAIIGIPILIALGVFQVVMIIIAAMKANDGVAYRYPLNLRLIK
jgi:uncharacterized Tic20 family protein